MAKPQTARLAKELQGIRKNLLCEVCGKKGSAAWACRFERCCSCWHGKPCKNGESYRQSFTAKK